jgi:hypothetical protein
MRTLVLQPDGSYAPLEGSRGVIVQHSPAEAPPDVQEDAGDMRRGQWWIAKKTEPEEGEAPAYDELSLDEKTAWFGYVSEDDPDDYGEKVWSYLGGWVARHFPGVHLMRTPALTGCLMIEHSLPWAHDEQRPYRYYTLPEGLDRLVAATTTPHRFELLTLPGRDNLREYCQYDARISYAAWLRSLPVIFKEGVEHDHTPVYEKHCKGRYLCAVTVPAKWAHIGLARRQLSEGGYDYPSSPGTTWTTWLEEPELRLLDDQGWPYTVQERILYADRRAPGADPLRVFCERIFPEIIRLDAARESNHARRALRHAYRALLTQPVGMWHRGSVKSYRHIEDVSEVREGEEVQSNNGQLTAATFAPLAGPVTRWRRPEWAAAIYGYEHAAMLKRALSVPRSALLEIRGDGIALADCNPLWADTGRIGCYRIKEYLLADEPRPAPHTEAEMKALRKAAKHG